MEKKGIGMDEYKRRQGRPCMEIYAGGLMLILKAIQKVLCKPNFTLLNKGLAETFST